jgi:hypothetical protein
MDSLTAHAHRVMTARIERLGLKQHPGLLFSIHTEGYREYAFGARTGPSIGLSNVFHELAHAAEFGPEQFDQRASAQGYRFNLPEVWVYDRFCVEPATMQAIERELRTFAYQYYLMCRAGYRLDRSLFARKRAPLMSYMADWLCVPATGEEARVAYCASRILDYIEEVSSEKALERLCGWLDLTAKKLDKLKDSEEEKYCGKFSAEPRYRADGSLY